MSPSRHPNRRHGRTGGLGAGVVRCCCTRRDRARADGRSRASR
jgi:hypothetical protein